MDALEEVDRSSRRLDVVFAERELVELPHADPLVLAQRVEELEQLDRMNRACDEVVVPAAQVVVDVHAEEASVVDRQLRGVGRRLAAVQRVTEVEQDPDVRQVELLE